jgi:hypothetical protein
MSRGATGRRRHAGTRRRDTPLFLVSRISAALALVLPAAGAFAQTLIHDGTTPPETAASLGLPFWVGVPTSLGVIYRDGGFTVTTNADLIIDDTSGTHLDFIIGGYSNGVGVEQNTVAIRQGSIQGNILGGLSQSTDITSDQHLSGTGSHSDTRAYNQGYTIARDNTATLDDHAVVAGVLFGGHAVLMAYAGNATNGGNDARSAVADAGVGHSSAGTFRNAVAVNDSATMTGYLFGGRASAYAHAGQAKVDSAIVNGSINAYAQADTAIDHTDISATANTLAVNGSATVTGHLFGGQAAVDAHAGTARVGDVTLTSAAGTVADVSASAMARINLASAHADENELTVAGGTIVTGKLYGGQAMIGAYGADATGATTIGPIGTDAQVRAAARTMADISQSSARANGNRLTVAGGASVTADLRGGHVAINAQSGTARGGTAIDFTYDSAIAQAFAWVQSSTVNADDNTLDLSDNATVTGDLYGGQASVSVHAGMATGGGGTARISSSTANIMSFSSLVLASVGQSRVQADTNRLIVGRYAMATGDLHGGRVTIDIQAQDARSDSVTTSANTADAATAASLSDSTVSASHNTVTLAESATAQGSLYGGRVSLTASTASAVAGTAATTGNYDSYTNATAVAGYSQAYVRADTNTIAVGENATVHGSLYGGHVALDAQAGTATGNTASATAGSVHSEASAATAMINTSLSATGNSVDLAEGAAVEGSLYGGRVSGSVRGGIATAGTADVSASGASGSSVAADATANIQDSAMRADGNTVTVRKNAAVRGSLYGGHASLDVQGGTAAGGMVTGATGVTADADASVLVGNSIVSASDNVVSLNGKSTDGGSIYGGYVRWSVAAGTASVAASGATARADVVSSGSRALATNNTVTIGDQARILGGNTSLYGGYLEAPNHKPERYDVFTGNTLNFSAQPVSVHTVANFEKLNFILQPALANQPTALISAQQIVLGSNADNLDSAQTAKASEIRVVGIHSGNALNAGDQFVLMRAASSLSGNGIGLTSTGVAQQGISLRYDVETRADLAGKEVTATILACQASAGETCPSTGSGGDSGGDSGGGSGGRPAARVNPQLKALSEGYLGGAMLVTRGADRIADEAFDAIAAQASGSGAASFALASASRSRYDSGSHVTSNDQFLAAGFGVRQEAFTAGAFIEGGWGNYDSHNSFYNAASVDGDGNARYYGAGLLGRYAFAGGFYTEASLRAGRTRLSFDTGDLQNLASGEFARYRLHSRYVSAHLGVGYELPLTTDQTLDLSAKYLGSRVGGKHVTVAGDPLHFERVDSQRLRLNAELAHRYSPAVTLKAGLGYEREFDGEAKATTYGSYKIEAPSVKGGTGLLSLGARVTPTASRNLSLDFAATGYVGQRDGGGASVQVQYKF